MRAAPEAAGRVEPREAAAAELLREELVPLYLHYIADHTTRLDSLGHVELASAFQGWRDRVVG